MSTRLYTKEDYPLLLSWWKQYPEWQNGVPEAILPLYGVISSVDDKPVAACFLYETKGNGCSWMEWIVADPQASREARDKGLDLAIEATINHAKAEGYNFLFTLVKHPRLIEKLEKFQFMTGDTGMRNMIKKV